MWKDILINHDIFVLAVGIILGLLTWDLAFETRRLKTAKNISMLRFYYQGIHNARIPVSLILPIAIILMFINLSYLVYQNGSIASWCALGLAFISIAIEVAIAIPQELKLWKDMDTPAEEDTETIQKMIGMIHTVRNVHIAMFIMFLATLYLVKVS